MANGMAMVMAVSNGNCDGRWCWRQQWPMARVLATAMVDSNSSWVEALKDNTGGKLILARE
jgi:hypothetical protein